MLPTGKLRIYLNRESCQETQTANRILGGLNAVGLKPIMFLLPISLAALPLLQASSSCCDTHRHRWISILSPPTHPSCSPQLHSPEMVSSSAKEALPLHLWAPLEQDTATWLSFYYHDQLGNYIHHKTADMKKNTWNDHTKITQNFTGESDYINLAHILPDFYMHTSTWYMHCKTIQQHSQLKASWEGVVFVLFLFCACVCMMYVFMMCVYSICVCVWYMCNETWNLKIVGLAKDADDYILHCEMDMSLWGQG